MRISINWIKDYVDLSKQNVIFAKKHWKGMLAVNAALVVGECAWLLREPIKNAVKEKLSKKNKEEQS